MAQRHGGRDSRWEQPGGAPSTVWCWKSTSGRIALPIRFAVTLDKRLHRNISVNWGYASIDRAYGNLNSDRFQVGDRAFAMLTCTISPELLALAFITRAVGNDLPLPQRTLANVIFTYNALPGLKRTGLF